MNTGTHNGILRFLGPTEFAPGEWAGVELETPDGKNDGSVGGVSVRRGIMWQCAGIVRLMVFFKSATVPSTAAFVLHAQYFTCPPLHGVFLKKVTVKRVGPGVLAQGMPRERPRTVGNCCPIPIPHCRFRCCRYPCPLPPSPALLMAYSMYLCVLRGGECVSTAQSSIVARKAVMSDYCYFVCFAVGVAVTAPIHTRLLAAMFLHGQSHV